MNCIAKCGYKFASVVGEEQEEYEENEVHGISFKHYFRQYLLAFSCFLHTVCVGSVITFASILFTQLEETSEFQLDTEQASWIISIPLLSMLPMMLISGVLLNILGRRRSFILLLTITLISWILTYIANSYQAMFTSRLISGIVLGMYYPTMMIFLGEAIQPNIRPLCLTSVPIGWNFSILLTQLLGVYIHWRTICLLVCILIICNLIISFYHAESFIWLLNKNNISEAKRTFIWYRGYGLKAKKEFLAALASKNKEINFSFKEKLKLCCTKEFLLPFRLTTIMYLTLEFTGDTAVIFYTSTIIKLITPDPQMQFYSNLMLNIIRLSTIVACLYFLRRFSIRRVLFVSGFALAGSLSCLSLFLYLSSVYPQQNIFSIICLVLIMCDVIFFCLGYSPVAIIICGELFPAAVRDIGGCLSIFISFIPLFLAIKYMPYLYIQVHPSVIFLIFACCTFTGNSILCFILPDTKNKTLKEIEIIYEEM